MFCLSREQRLYTDARMLHTGSMKVIGAILAGLIGTALVVGAADDKKQTTKKKADNSNTSSAKQSPQPSRTPVPTNLAADKKKPQLPTHVKPSSNNTSRESTGKLPEKGIDDIHKVKVLPGATVSPTPPRPAQ
jgi:hypothetical protein